MEKTTRNRLVGGVAGLVVAALVAAGTVMWLNRTSPDSKGAEGETDIVDVDEQDFEIDLDQPQTFDWESEHKFLTFYTDNNSNTPVPGATVDVTLEQPGGDFPELHLLKGGKTCSPEPGDEPDDPRIGVNAGFGWPDCTDDIKCPLPKNDENGYTTAPHAQCHTTLDTGSNDFAFKIRPPKKLSPSEWKRLVDYPKLTLTVEFSLDGDVFAAAESEVKTKYPKEWQNVGFDGVPDEMKSDRKRKNPVEWSFTIGNNTGGDIFGAEAHIGLESEDITIEAAGSGCRAEDRARVSCEGLSIPAGGEVTFPMLMYAQSDFEADCDREPDDCAYSFSLFVQAYDGDRGFASSQTDGKVELVD